MDIVIILISGQALSYEVCDGIKMYQFQIFSAKYTPRIYLKKFFAYTKMSSYSINIKLFKNKINKLYMVEICHIFFLDFQLAKVNKITNSLIVYM